MSSVLKIPQTLNFTFYDCKKLQKSKQQEVDSGGDIENINLRLTNQKKLCSQLNTEYGQIFKCISNKQSESIIENCQEYYFQPKDSCQTQDNWLAMSREKCQKEETTLGSFKFLKSCASEMSSSGYEGIEFKCCRKTDMEVALLNQIPSNSRIRIINATSSKTSSDKNDSGGTKTNGTQILMIVVIFSVFIGFGISFILKRIIIRRKLSLLAGSSHRADFRSMSDSMNPEEVHVNSMQVNGYENPTYKFFEYST
jgi:hypothetical protein